MSLSARIPTRTTSEPGDVPSYIVDASIAIKWYLDDEDHTVEANEILTAYQDGRVCFTRLTTFVMK